MGKSSGGAPATPDPTKLIGAQSAADKSSFNYQTDANRYATNGPDSSTSWDKKATFDQAGYDAAMGDWEKNNRQGTWVDPTNGTQTYDPITGELTTSGGKAGYWSGTGSDGTPSPDKANFTSYDWTQNTTLSPEQQKLHDLTQSSQVGQAGLLDALTGRLKDTYAKPVDYSGVNPLDNSYQQRLASLDPNSFNQKASDAAYNSAATYLDPQVKQQQQALEARLSEQGFVPGTPGYNQAMQNFQDTNNRQYAAARDSATTQGFSAGHQQFADQQSSLNSAIAAMMGTHSQGLSDLFAERSQPLNELNAIRSGNQVGAPSGSGTSGTSQGGAGTLAAPDVMGAYNAQYKSLLDKYNAGVNSDNADTQTAGQIIGAIASAFSDKRLKSNINKIGSTPGGHDVYEYDIMGHHSKGVMAQDVLDSPDYDAVSLDPSGYLKVDYSRVS